MSKLLIFLQKLSVQEREPLVKILGLKNGSPETIDEKFCKTILPVGGFFQKAPNYIEVLHKIAENNNIQVDGLEEGINGVKLSKPISVVESDLFTKLFSVEFEKMTNEEKAQFKAILKENGMSSEQIASLTSLGAVTAAQISGFGIYVLASSTVGAITSLLGITLPFAFYTGMSSAISVVIGPIGFLVIGVMLWRSFRKVKSFDEALDILKSTGKKIKGFVMGDIEKVTIIFKYIASARIIKIENLKKREVEISGNIKDLENQGSLITREENSIKNDIDNLKAEIFRLNSNVNIKERNLQEKREEKERLNKELFSRIANLAIIKSSITALN